MATAQALTVLSLLCAVAAAVCAWRVSHIGLLKIDPVFFAYLLSQSVFLISASVAGAASVWYAWTYLIGYPLTLVLYCLIVGNLYKEIFSGYPGIAMSGRCSIYISVAVAILAGILTRAATRQALSSKRTILISLELAGRSLVFGLAILIVLIILMLWRYPISLRQNVVVNCACFSVLLLEEAGANLADHLTGLRHTLLINELTAVIDIGCFGLWCSLLSREGETRTVRILQPRRVDEERRLLAELNSLNAIIMRTARK